MCNDAHLVQMKIHGTQNFFDLNPLDHVHACKYAYAMSDPLSAAEIEVRAKAKGLSVARLCEEAGVAHSTFTRWRAGKTEPTLGVYRRLLSALNTIVSD